MELNISFVRIYYLKEEFLRFWDYRQTARAQALLQQWLCWDTHSRLKPFIEFARFIKAHLSGLLAWIKLRISNGALEGMNNQSGISGKFKKLGKELGEIMLYSSEDMHYFKRIKDKKWI